jgi:predicted dehydrogenase
MDVGSYTVHMLRTLAGAQPEVIEASAKLSSPGVDRWMQADMRFPGGRTARMTCSLFSAHLLGASVRVSGDEGWMRVLNPTTPQLYNRIRVRTTDGVRTERCTRVKTYTCQLQAFVDAILKGAPVLTPPADSVANMEVIDAIYERSGLGPRGEPGR